MKRKSAVRMVTMTADGRSIGHAEPLKGGLYIGLRSEAGLSELGVERKMKRFFGETLEDFHERVREMRALTRAYQEARER